MKEETKDIINPKNKAAQKPDTETPSTHLPANKITIISIIQLKIPNVIKFNRQPPNFIKLPKVAFNKPRTMENIIATHTDDILTPGMIALPTNAAMALTIILTIMFYLNSNLINFFWPSILACKGLFSN